MIKRIDKKDKVEIVTDVEPKWIQLPSQIVVDLGYSMFLYITRRRVMLVDVNKKTKEVIGKSVKDAKKLFLRKKWKFVIER